MTAVGTASTPTPRTVKSAERTLRLLEIVSTAPTGMTMTDLHRLSGYPRSSLHHLIKTMAASDWLSVHADGSRMAIGPRALVAGTSYLDHDAALEFAVPAIEALRTRVGYTTHYARLHGSNVLYLATREASQRAASRVGRFLPAHATALGKVLLAERSPAELEMLLRDELVALTPLTITDGVDLERELEEIRAIGASSEREENTMGVACVAASVGYRIPATDAMSCSIPIGAATASEVARVMTEVRVASMRLATALRSRGVR